MTDRAFPFIRLNEREGVRWSVDAARKVVLLTSMAFALARRLRARTRRVR